MRSINTAATSSFDVQIQSTAVESVITLPKDCVEMRFTVKKSNSDKTLFYFGKCGMRRNSKNGNLFGEFRPFPLLTQLKDGEKAPVLDSEGNQKTGAFWSKWVSQPAVTLTAEEEMQFKILSKRPDLIEAGFPVSSNLHLALNANLEYEDADLKKLFLDVLGYSNIKFKFNVPSQFHSVVENLQKLVENAKDKEYYSLVIRFSMSEKNIRSKDEGPVPEYSNADIDVHHLYINEVCYVGYVKGATLDEREELRHIDFSEAIRKLRERKVEPKATNFTKEEIKSWADRVNEKLNSIKNGNKGHISVRDEYISAAKSGQAEVAKLAMDALKAKAEKGDNPKVTTQYVETLEKENPIIEKLDEINEGDLLEVFED